MNSIPEIFDVFFNGRPARDAKPAVTIEELIRRGTSHVLVDGTIYRIEVTKAELVGKQGSKASA